ncbi:hypothetical protein WDU94_001083 [Cyamophila willieti]
MGKRAGKKRNKKQKENNANKENTSKSKENQQFTGKIIIDKFYNGKLRSAVTTLHMDDEISLQMMAEGLVSLDGLKYELYSIERLNSKEKKEDGRVEFVPSNSYKLSFKGDRFPLNMEMKPSESWKNWGHITLVLDCRPWYNNVIQCYKCLRYRHLSTTCKGYARCAKCGAHKENNHKCALPTLKCANCKGEHEAMDANCPVHLFHKDVNKIMADQNVDYKSAVKIYNTCTKEDDTQTPTEAKKVKFLDNISSLKLKGISDDMLKELESYMIQALNIQKNTSQQQW